MQKPWDRIILVSSLALLLIVSTGLAFLFPVTTTTVPPFSAAAFKMDEEARLAQAKQDWAEKALWAEVTPAHRLFLSERYWIFPDTSRIELVSPDSVIQGIPLKWLEEFKIDYRSPTVANEDPDGDFFTNKEEFDAQTNPKDQTSHPKYITRLRLKDVTFKEFRLSFKSYDPSPPAAGKQPESFYINLIDVPGQPSKRVRKGDNLEGYIIGEFRFKMVKQAIPGTSIMEEVDRSELDIEKPEIKFKFTLVRGQQMNSPEVTADFLMLLPGQTDQTIRVGRGGEFEIPQEPGKKYQLLNAKEEGLIYDLTNKVENKIPKVTPEELDRYAQPPATPVRANP
ncbi:hypothetical protein DB346_11135 [Verrucomicrobia bacterium LW23]|nr:hypothetical protein DB346_11135 [Verrucomicrobia bacterium LW23]